MKIIPETYVLRGFEYRQIERTSKAAIYAQYLDGELIAYEVVKVIWHPEREIMGKAVEEGESLPGDVSWGTHGFTAYPFERAMQIYTLLNEINSNT